MVNIDELLGLHLRLVVMGVSLLMSTAGICMDTSTKIFDPDVMTLALRNADDFMGTPVIRLGSTDCLDINFDMMGERHEYLRARIIHCNADWQPSSLTEPEYNAGLNEAEVTDYAYSSGTFAHYVNYNIRIPDEGIKPMVSGNYLLQVYREDGGEVILQHRLQVSEDTAHVSGEVTTCTDRGFNTEYQQLRLSVDLGDDTTVDPYSDLEIEIMQNNRPQSRRVEARPLRVEGRHVVYDHMPEMIFPGGNEFRRFETVRAGYEGMHVDSTAFVDGMWHVWLAPDIRRAQEGYVFDRTQHGRFKIDEYSADNPDLGADYVMVHFYLDPYGLFTPEGILPDIYVDGDFTLHQHGEGNKMRMDEKTGFLTAGIPLKQGSYNYQYVSADKEGKMSPSFVEGDMHETGNEYLVNIFLRKKTARADRLIASILLRE